MKKLVLLLLVIVFSFFQLSPVQAETVEDPFTIYIQEKLIALGLLEGEPTGINDQATQQAIKAFQEKAGLDIDGLVGVNTFPKLLLGESAYLQTSPTTTVPVTPTTTIPTGPDTKPPVWDEEQPPYASEIGTLFNLNMPSVTDNVGIVSYEVYVNGALSTYATISDSRLLVTPKYDMTCADQIIYVIAFDEAGNSSQSPAFTIPQREICISTSSSSESSSSPQISTKSFAVSFGGTSFDVGYGITVDSSGNSYITGDFRGTVDFGGGDVTAAGVLDIFVLKLNTSGVFQWVYTVGGSGNSAQGNTGYGIGVDSSGNSYITGRFEDTVDFGEGDITDAGDRDIFVLKLDSSGVFQWVYTAGGTSRDNGTLIDIDSSGNSYITGFFSGTVDFGGGDITSAGSYDIFVLKLNSSGVFQWVYTAGSTGLDAGNAIDIDSSGNSYITGYFVDTVDFGGGDITAAGDQDIFVLKLNSSGVFQSVYILGSTSAGISADGIGVDSSGNSYIAGYFSGTVDFGGGDITSAGSYDIFVLKLNSSDVFQWVYTAGGTSGDFVKSMNIDSSGNSYTTGYFLDTVDFGGGDVTSAGSWEIFVLKLDSSGVFQWVYRAGSTSLDAAYGIAVDSSGNSYTTGFFSGTVDFGGGDITSAGSWDTFLLKLNPSGIFE